MIAIIENSDNPEEAEFMYDDYGVKLLFKDYDDADEYLSRNAESGIGYKMYDGND